MYHAPTAQEMYEMVRINSGDLPAKLAEPRYFSSLRRPPIGLEAASRVRSARYVPQKAGHETDSVPARTGVHAKDFGNG